MSAPSVLHPAIREAREVIVELRRVVDKLAYLLGHSPESHALVRRAADAHDDLMTVHRLIRTLSNSATSKEER